MPKTKLQAGKGASKSAVAAADAFSAEDLAQVPLLRGLSPKGLETARKAIRQRVLVPGEILVAEDEHGDSMFMLMKGAAKITVRKGENIVLLGMCGPGELLGELAAIDGQARSATVTAQTPCIVGVLTAKDFWSRLWPLEPVPLNVSNLLVERVRRLTSKVQAMATLSVRSRLAFQIVLLARQHATKVEEGEVIPFGLTQAEFANMVGTSRVQINQLMTAWAKDGILTARRNSIVVHRLGELYHMFPTSLEMTPSTPSYN